MPLLESRFPPNPLGIAVGVVIILVFVILFQVSPGGHVFLVSTEALISSKLSSVLQRVFVVELVRSTLVALVILVLGSAWRYIPKSVDLLRAARFWGKGIQGEGIALCCGSLESASEANQARYTKAFRDGRRVLITGPSEGIIGLCEVRAASYVINALSKYRQKPLPIEDDKTCLRALNRSILAIGSASSNEITEIIQTDPRNEFLGIDMQTAGAVITCRTTGAILNFGPSQITRDYGIILKITNVRFPDQNLFVCAGLGEWGTSGAAWYLANHWKDLNAYGEEFGCVVEVELGSDQSAQIVYNPVVAKRRILTAKDATGETPKSI